MKRPRVAATARPPDREQEIRDLLKASDERVRQWFERLERHQHLPSRRRRVRRED